MNAASISLESLVNGQWITGSGPQIQVENPARPAEIVAVARLAGADDVQAAVAAAAAALPAWSRAPMHERAGVLTRTAALLEARAPALGMELSREEGKTLPEAVGEVRRAAQILRYQAAAADRATGAVHASPRAGEQVLVEHVPVGVIGVITPFNFPIAIPAWKIAPALVHGNTVVWKPAERVPLLAYRLTQCLVEAGLPAGVLNLVIGDGSAGHAIVVHPQVAAVTFTGSTMVGHALIAACGRMAKPVQTEMGGKNAAVVMPSADLGAAVEMVVSGAFASAGQKCTSTSRLILHSAIADEFIDRLVERMAHWRTGDPLDESVDMGPVISEQACALIHKELDESLVDGTRLLVGDLADPVHSPAGSGWFMEPIVLDLGDARPSAWTEELFGPVLAVVRGDDLDEIIALVDDTEFGLTAAVHTHDAREISAFRDRLDVGILHVNSETTGAEPHVPFGGHGASAFGPHEQGESAREFYTRTRTTYLRVVP